MPPATALSRRGLLAAAGASILSRPAPAAPRQASGRRAPLALTLTFADGKTLAFRQSEAQDIGDYAGPFVRQKCFRQRAGGNGDYRDGFTVFFRPDADGRRSEVVVEYGTEFDFSGPPPRPARGAVPAHAPPYTATISGGPAVPPIAVPAHWWSARWRWQSAPRPIVRRYADLVAMRAILPLDGSLSYGARAHRAHLWQGPMDTGGLLPGMPTTGDRPDIGLLTEWQASWLVAGNADSEATWRAGAEATGTMTFWARDAETGGPVDLLTHPLVAYKDAQSGGHPNQVPTCARPAGVPTYFILNEAHMPAAAFVPWLLTDDPYFLEGAQAIAQYGIMESNYRPLTEKLPALANTASPRSWAWSLRDLMQLAALAPERTPAWLQPRAYWRKLLPNSLTFAKRYLTATASPCTTVFRLMTLTNAFESFMQDYITIVLGWAKWNGAFPEWNPVLDYAATPRMVMSDPTGQSGWDPRYQVPYLVPVVNARLGAAATLAANTLYAVANSPETPTSWRELWGCFCRYAATSRNEPGWTDPATWPADRLLPLHRNYLPEARAALAALTLAGVPGAAARHNWLKTRMDRQFPVCPGASYKWAVRPA